MSMNASMIQDNATAIAVILPEPEIVQIPRANGVVEKLEIMPMPFRKWRIGFRYIVRLAPLFGFNLEETSLDALADLNAPLNAEIIFAAMQSDGADLIYEFLAFALGKFKADGVTPDVSFFDDIYEQAIDIAVGVIKANIVFFVQRLLPKLMVGTVEVLTLRNNILATATSTTTPAQ
jgi:hypothetical protein